MKGWTRLGSCIGSSRLEILKEFTCLLVYGVLGALVRFYSAQFLKLKFWVSKLRVLNHQKVYYQRVFRCPHCMRYGVIKRVSSGVGWLGGLAGVP